MSILRFSHLSYLPFSAFFFLSDIYLPTCVAEYGQLRITGMSTRLQDSVLCAQLTDCGLGARGIISSLWETKFVWKRDIAFSALDIRLDLFHIHPCFDDSTVVSTLNSGPIRNQFKIHYFSIPLISIPPALLPSACRS